ncbi:hypothetical protein O6H91_16G075000 [Diphasiastrum complanatum]|uniref:Uncharacterized protein n=1 Tax=Diphasiastrum complanatum TaxID=34168 RepID=A0ACC2BDT9_DIPCM|nr:hypothetical protein O6H91_16G075000 [Diphasiastrum complanatum]
MSVAYKTWEVQTQATMSAGHRTLSVNDQHQGSLAKSSVVSSGCVGVNGCDICNRSQPCRKLLQDLCCKHSAEIKGAVRKAASKEKQSSAQNLARSLEVRSSSGTLYSSSICHESNCLKENSLPDRSGSSWMIANDPCQSCSPSSSSSIGANSSCTSVEESLAGTAEEEVESCRRDTLEDMASLGAFLPPRKGLSRFIGGKSQSFTNLAEVRSIKDLVKPENPYASRRRFSIHSINAFERHRCPPTRISGYGIFKKSVCSSKRSLALALEMSSKENDTEAEDWDLQKSLRPSAENSSSSRSFSVADLQRTGSLLTEFKKHRESRL